jgi:PII-like signaling protein
MKSILKATLAGAVAAGVFNALLGRMVARQAQAFRRLRVADDVPTVNPIADAEPYMEEPLQESDLRVAQNAPL